MASERKKGGAPRKAPAGLGKVLFVRTDARLQQALERLRESRTRPTEATLSLADVVRSLIAEAAERECPEEPQFVRVVWYLGSRRLGPVERELRAKQGMTLRELYGSRVSAPARQVLSDAATAITGMVSGPNDHWLPDIMSEAIEAAEALGL